MARTRQRKSAATESVEDDHDSSQPANPSTTKGDDTQTRALRSNAPLSWRVGRAPTVSDLLSTLQDLFTELCDIDQADADREALLPKAQELAGKQLIEHKDKGVKAWTLCCIVKMFHLLAPNAPYKAGQLQDIFTLFATQVIPAFAESMDPYLQQYIEILNSFTNDRSVLLISDAPNWEALTTQVFQTAFDVMAGNSKNSTSDRVPKNVEYQLTACLADIVQDNDALPSGVVDAILTQFLRTDGTITGAETGNTSFPAYDMARAVCNSCTPNMIRHISSYYSSVLLDAVEIAQNVKNKPRGKKRKHDEEDDGDDTVNTTHIATDLGNAEKAHKLLRELWQASPDIIQGVMPQIESEISAEDAQLRVMAVQAVSDMISGVGATEYIPNNTLDPAAWPSQSLLHDAVTTRSKYVAPYSFSKHYPECYRAFIDRCRDKSSTVRSAWVTGAGRILATNAGGKGIDADQEAELLQHINHFLGDNDERVRLAAIEALSTLSYTTLVSILSKDGGMSTSGSLLASLSARIKDLRPAVRGSAIDLLARLWGVASGALAENDTAVHAVVDLIPTRIFEARYINQPDVNNKIPQVIHDLLLPIFFPPSKGIVAGEGAASKDTSLDLDAVRAERILLLVGNLEDRAMKVFLGLQGQQAQKARILSTYLDRCEAAATNKKDKDIEQALEKLIVILTKELSDPDTAAIHLQQFAKQSDKRNIQLIRFCLAPDSDYKKVTKAMKELYRRLGAAASPLPSILETLQPLLKAASMLVYNRSHVPTYMRFAKSDEKGLSSAANTLLKHIASTSSEVFKIHAAELCQSLQRSSPKDSTPSDPSAVYALKTCVGFARQYPEGMPKDRAFYQAMTDYALYGSPPKTAKHAVSIIVAAADKKEMLVDNLLKKCVKNFKYGEPHFLSRLAALAQLLLLANDQASEESDEITTIAVHKILKQARTTPEIDDPLWTDTDEHDEDLAAKLLAIKILVNSLRGQHTSEDSQEALASLSETAKPVYKLLNTLIERDGEIHNGDKTPQNHRSQLRLAAGISLLKLCTNRTLDKFLSATDFTRLAKLCQDELPEVRAIFGKNLRKYLGRGKLPSRFLSLTFLYTFEPCKDVKLSMQTWIKARAAAAAKDDRVDTILEAIFPRLLSLLTHFHDFSQELKDLRAITQVIVFYLVNVATENNLPALYNIAQRLKTVQDGINPDKSEDLYLMSDLAEATIRAYHEEKGWVLQTMTEKVRLPAGLFMTLPADVDAQDLVEKRFLPDDMVDMIPDLVKSILKPRRKKETTKKVKDTIDDSTVRPAKKRASTASTRKRGADSETPEPKVTKKSKPVKDADESTRRRSSRSAKAAKSYAEMDSDEEDEELKKWNDDEADKENHEQIMTDTPPTSEPVLEEEDIQMTATSSPPAKSKPTRGKKALKNAISKKPSARSSARITKQTDEFEIPDDSD